MKRLDILAFVVGVMGFALMVAGIGVIYWPAALIVGGAGLLVWSFLAARAAGRAGAQFNSQAAFAAGRNASMRE